MDEQNKTPYLDALKSYIKEGISPFDVPGHHMGNVKNDFKALVGNRVYQCDVNAPRGLDNLNHPNGVIKDAQNLMAQAYNADEAYFLINGTTSGILASILSTTGRHDKIILPRNCHKSVINALILSGATPIFVMPELDLELEIANQPSVASYEEAITANPDAKAVFVINPTYFGAVADLKKIVAIAHANNMIVIVDEAHGAHFGFNYYGPYSAMECGADLSAVSLHKTLGALTQASVLLKKGDRVSRDEIKEALAMINTTSPSALLMASLDAARKYMATAGQVQLNDTVNLANYARKEIDRIPGFKACGREHFLKHQVFDYDDTKLVIELDNINLTGFELYNMLRDEYQIQMELAEAYTLLGIIAIGSKKSHIDHLIWALKDISNKYYKEDIKYPKYHYDQNFPQSRLSPREAYQLDSQRIKLTEAKGYISKESIMVYPPGIPLIIPGEIFNDAIIERILKYKQTGATVLSKYQDGTVSVVKED